MEFNMQSAQATTAQYMIDPERKRDQLSCKSSLISRASYWIDSQLNNDLIHYVH